MLGAFDMVSSHAAERQLFPKMWLTHMRHKDCMATASHFIEVNCRHARKGLLWEPCVEVQMNHKTIGFLEALRMELYGTETLLYLKLLVS